MENQEPMFEDTSARQAKAWIQGNLRIIVSVFIVAFTAVSFALAQQATAQQRWTNDAGKTITAQFIRLEGANVVLRLADGREVPYPLAKLNAASQQQARKLAAAREPKVQGAQKEKPQPAPTRGCGTYCSRRPARPRWRPPPCSVSAD